MSLADALEDERRETADMDSPPAGKRGLMDSVSAVRNMLDISSKDAGRASSQDRRSGPFTAGTLDVLQSPSGKKIRKQSASAEAMAAIFGGTPKDFQVSSRARGSGRHNSTAGIGAQSRSPSSRVHRSSSPGLGLLNNNRSSPMHIMTDSSDFNEADATNTPPTLHLKSKGSVSDSLIKHSGQRGRQGSVDSSNDVRLEKDQHQGENADEGAIESSEDEEEAKSSDEDEESTPDRKRGRGRSRLEKESDVSQADSEESEDDPYASLYGQNKSSRQAKSLLAAAEEDRKWLHSLLTSRY
jgi:hypothetical protein